MFVLLLLVLPAARSQVPTSPSVDFRNYQHHPFNAVQFIQPKTTKKGPILFPNDAPPPPPPPLIVTSRPLIESIARSELNPNNSQAAQSRHYQVYENRPGPDYLARYQTYKPYAYESATVTPARDLGSTYQPYADSGPSGQGRGDRYFNDYEQQPPVLNARTKFHSDDVKNTNIRLMHRSLYSRETNNNNEEHHHHRHNQLIPTKTTPAHRRLPFEDDLKEFNKVNRRRRNYQRRRRKRIPYRRSLNQVFNSGFRNRRKSFLVKRRRDPTLARRRSILDDSEKYKDRDRKTENLIDENRRDLQLRPSYRLVSESENSNSPDKNRGDRSTEYMSDSSYIILRRRTSHKLNEPERERESLSWHSSENLSDRSYKILKKRPYHNSDQSDNIEKILHARSNYKSLSQSSSKNLEQSSKNLRRPFHASFNRTIAKSATTPTTETILINKAYRHEAKNISKINENSRKNYFAVQMRPTYAPNDKNKRQSEEIVAQPRAIKLLYEVNGDREQKTKTVHANEEPLKAKSRPQARIPTANAYFPNTIHANEGKHGNENDYNQNGENYAFSYTVRDNKTGDDFSHSQHSTGTATNGEYRVVLPDGRTQIVSYTADENGYKADVRYDDHHNNDNSIDDISRENQYNTNDAYKNHNAHNSYDDHLNSHDITDDADYPLAHYNAKPRYVNYYVKQQRPNNNHQDFDHADDFIDHTNDEAQKHAYVHKNDYVHKTGYTHTSDFAHKTDFADTTKNLVDNVKNGGLTDINNDYLQHYKDKNPKSQLLKTTHDDDYFQFSDEIPFTKEVMDYSNEFNHAYQPHKSKFSSFDNHKTVKSTVRPSYEELKDIFAINGNLRRQNSVVQVGSTSRPSFEVKKPNLYTSIRNVVAITPSPITYSTPFASTPRGYLVSTIANLKHRVNAANKPVLSREYLDKINKYLTYK